MPQQYYASGHYIEKMNLGGVMQMLRYGKIQIDLVASMEDAMKLLEDIEHGYIYGPGCKAELTWGVLQKRSTAFNMHSYLAEEAPPAKPAGPSSVSA